ncbi:MAG: signal peptidase II [Candidatus Omnitrophica bacterium]|nr:signal peptidase II [Candidatus Omnitrophota bacterium]MDD5654259.1 signal peptidase II [Candidatus Omnitrophota bacterium]
MRASASNARKKEKNSVQLRGAGIWMIIAVLLLDQLTKALITRYIPLNQSVVLIKNVFSFTLVYNTGGAFGIFKNQTILFIVISLIALPAIYFSFKVQSGRRRSAVTRVALSLVVAGAIGNLIDRISCGYVIDFLDFHIWPVFNVADSAITIGAVLLGYSLLKTKE